MDELYIAEGSGAPTAEEWVDDAVWGRVMMAVMEPVDVVRGRTDVRRGGDGTMVCGDGVVGRECCFIAERSVTGSATT